MNDTHSKDHWEKIYATKDPHELSWTQENPAISLDFIRSFHLSKNASIIDVGGGDSKLVDRLLEDGYEDITVLDISHHSLQRAKNRLGDNANKVNWVVADITKFDTDKTYDLWHDRATFHFMTTTGQINDYLVRAKKNLKNNGFMTIGTFSQSGPQKCSGLEIKQYSEQSLQDQLKSGFLKLKCVMIDHLTPFDTMQNFLFCSFRRQENSHA
jgi:ubiquinone/menaquinone biosynthesis C-methylase UbiE